MSLRIRLSVSGDIPFQFDLIQLQAERFLPLKRQERPHPFVGKALSRSCRRSFSPLHHPRSCPSCNTSRCSPLFLRWRRVRLRPATELSFAERDDSSATARTAAKPAGTLLPQALRKTRASSFRSSRAIFTTILSTGPTVPDDSRGACPSSGIEDRGLTRAEAHRRPPPGRTVPKAMSFSAS